MEFWGVEVKSGIPLSVDPGEDKLVHITLAVLGEKKDNGNKPVRLYVKSGDQKLDIGTLSHDKIPQLSPEIVFEERFELSHSWKNGSVFFSGYKDDDMTDDEQAVAGAEPAVNFQLPNKDDDDSEEESEDESEDDSEDSGDEEGNIKVELCYKNRVKQLLGRAFTQDCNNCVSVNLVRQFEYHLRRLGRLGGLGRLSIQELMDLIPRRHVAIGGDGACSASIALKTLEAHGTVLSRDRPNLQKQHRRCRKTLFVRRFKPKEVEEHYRQDYLSPYYFELCIRRKLRSHGPFTVSFRVYPSYEELGPHDVYCPTRAEKRAHKRKKEEGHCLFAVAIGRRRRDGLAVLECQDSQGPDWGHGGYIYIALHVVDSIFLIHV